VVKDLSAFIQTGPQVSARGVGLSEQRLSRHRLVSPFDDRMVCGTHEVRNELLKS
jgi:hypothetical protein